jgi:hypothetical protein
MIGCCFLRKTFMWYFVFINLVEFDTGLQMTQFRKNNFCRISIKQYLVYRNIIDLILKVIIVAKFDAKTFSI